MDNYDIILFDLDGTLTDPGEGITNSVAYALNKFNIEIEDKKQLFSFIGPPLHESFEKYYGFTPTDAMKAVDCYREYYNVKGIYENFVYDGITEVLKTLKENGKTVCLATSKPEIYARQILDHFKLSQYFDYIAGANMDGTRTKKDEVIDYALSLCKPQSLCKVVMVGDREFDIIGAENCGIDSIGVLFGYGDRNELENAGATHIAEKVIDILNYV